MVILMEKLKLMVKKLMISNQMTFLMAMMYNLEKKIKKLKTGKMTESDKVMIKAMKIKLMVKMYHQKTEKHKNQMITKTIINLKPMDKMLLMIKLKRV